MELNNPLKCVSVYMYLSETAVLSVNITNNKNGSKNFKIFLRSGSVNSRSPLIAATSPQCVLSPSGANQTQFLEFQRLSVLDQTRQ